MRKSSTLLIIGLLFFVATASYTGYMFWADKSDKDHLAVVESSLSDLRKKEMQNQNKEVLQAITAKKTVTSIKTDMIVWSQVMKAIIATLPKEDNRPIVSVSSYSGNDKKEISMNVKTNPLSEDPYLDVAKLISAFDSSSAFTDVFVPSISAGADSEGRDILSFLLTVQYTGASEEAVVSPEDTPEEEVSQPAVATPVKPISR